MNFKSISEIFKRASGSNIKTPLGRWNIHNYRETTLKIKYATEDNCGISYSNYKNIPKMQEKNELDDDKKERKKGDLYPSFFFLFYFILL
jgi:hypothetical protein